MTPQPLLLRAALTLALSLAVAACSSGDSGGSAGSNGGALPADDEPSVDDDSLATQLTLGIGDESTADDPPDDDFPTRNIDWAPCDVFPSLECGTLVVPMNYNDPDGATVSLALARSTADPARRRGSLLTNPGGPGGPGIDLLFGLIQSQAVPPALLAEYDIVGFDPRGIGGSDEITCSEFDTNAFNFYPRTREELQQQVTNQSEFAAACEQKYGVYLQLIGSNNVVRDMEEIRLAMGDDELNFIGYSYGTRLASLYLQQFPQSSGRMILDGSLPPDPGLFGLAEGGLAPAQANIERMLSFCLFVDLDCEPEPLLDTLEERVDELRTNGPARDFQLLTIILAISARIPEFAELAIGPLYVYLTEDNIEPLEGLIGFFEPMMDEMDAPAPFNFTANTAVLCADDPLRPTADNGFELFAGFNEISDLFAESFLTVALTCAGWPESIDPVIPVATSQAPNSLIIGGSTDAQTPLIWAEQMASAIGGTFLRSEHLGHTVVFNDESACADNAAVAFLREGSVPSVTTCLADP